MCAPYPQVSCTVSTESSGKGRTRPIYSYEGTFVTRDGAVFVVPPATGRLVARKATRKIEERMLAVLYSVDGNPRADTSVASRFVDLTCEIRILSATLENSAVRARNQEASGPGLVLISSPPLSTNRR